MVHNPTYTRLKPPGGIRDLDTRADFIAEPNILLNATLAAFDGAIAKDYSYAFSEGPKDVGDASQGLNDRAWYARWSGTDVYLAKANDAGTAWESEVLFSDSVPTSFSIANRCRMSLSFNAAAGAVIAISADDVGTYVIEGGVATSLIKDTFTDTDFVRLCQKPTDPTRPHHTADTGQKWTGNFASSDGDEFEIFNNTCKEKFAAGGDHAFMKAGTGGVGHSVGDEVWIDFYRPLNSGGGTTSPDFYFMSNGVHSQETGVFIPNVEDAYKVNLNWISPANSDTAFLTIERTKGAVSEISTNLGAVIFAHPAGTMLRYGITINSEDSYTCWYADANTGANRVIVGTVTFTPNPGTFSFLGDPLQGFLGILIGTNTFYTDDWYCDNLELFSSTPQWKLVHANGMLVGAKFDATSARSYVVYKRGPALYYKDSNDGYSAETTIDNNVSATLIPADFSRLASGQTAIQLLDKDVGNFVIGFNLRSTVGGATDGPNEFFVNRTDLYPTTYGTIQAGWDAAPLSAADIAGLDRRMQGEHTIPNANDPLVFRIDLPSTGRYRIGIGASVALSFGFLNQKVVLQDNQSPIATLSDSNIPIGSMLSVPGQVLQNVWSNGFITIDHTFASSILNVIVGDGPGSSDFTRISHIFIQKMPDDAGSEATFTPKRIESTSMNPPAWGSLISSGFGTLLDFDLPVIFEAAYSVTTSGYISVDYRITVKDGDVTFVQTGPISKIQFSKVYGYGVIDSIRIVDPGTVYTRITV